MHRRTAGCLLALAIAACGGDAFTGAPPDGGPTSADGAIDTGVADGSVEDAEHHDASSHDASREDAGPMSDDGPDLPPADGGSADASPADAAACARTCPSGFDCVATKCEDRAALHFTPANNPGLSNWRYGYSVDLGGTFNIYPSHWKVAASAAASIDVWSRTTNSIEPSVFHNEALTTVDYDGMVLPGIEVGLYPGPMGETSVLRWVAPVAGPYAIDVTFTGISYSGTTPTTVATVGVFINGTSGPNTGGALNEYTEGNTFTYSTASQMMAAGDTLDFYVSSAVTADDGTGGVEVEAKLTAE